ILQLRRRRLVGLHRAFGVGLEVDVDLAFGADVLGAWVVGELAAVYLVKAVRLAAVDDDVDLVELRAPALLELQSVRRSHREQRAPALGARNRPTLGALLHVEPKLFAGILGG